MLNLCTQFGIIQIYYFMFQSLFSESRHAHYLCERFGTSSLWLSL